MPLLDQRYWSRLWVVQEIVVAKELTIRFRTLRVHWAVFIGCLEYALGELVKDQSALETFRTWPYVSEGNSRLVRDTKALQTFYLLSERRRMMREAPARRMTLSRAIMSFANQDCSVVHDKVFGVIGMTTSSIEVDYEASVEELYVRVLADGLFDLFTQRLLMSRRAVDTKLDRLRFAFQLANALGLSLYKPLIFYLTKECLESYGDVFPA